MVAVYWYLRCRLSYRDVEELLVERGIDVEVVPVREVGGAAPVERHSLTRSGVGKRQSGRSRKFGVGDAGPAPIACCGPYGRGLAVESRAIGARRMMITEGDRPKPPELVSLYAATSAVFRTLKEEFQVPDTYELALCHVDAAEPFLRNTVDIAAITMRKIQALRWVAKPGAPSLPTADPRCICIPRRSSGDPTDHALRLEETMCDSVVS